MSYPDVSERLSHGSPTFFYRERRAFVMMLDDHHGDGRLALWCSAEPGTQEALVASDPDTYFRPPYVGHRGWLGVRLDRSLTDADLAAVVEEAYGVVSRQGR